MKKHSKFRPERFISEPGRCFIISGPNRGTVVGMPPGTPLSPGQKKLLLSQDYSDQFNNLDLVSHPSVYFDRRFDDLMIKAIARKSPLTRAEVEEVFGKVAWK